MVIPENQDGKSEDVNKTNQPANQTVSSSRKGGVQTAPTQQSKVCVILCGYIVTILTLWSRLRVL